MKLYELAQNYAQLLEMAEEMESDALVDTLSALQIESEKAHAGRSPSLDMG